MITRSAKGIRTAIGGEEEEQSNVPLSVLNDFGYGGLQERDRISARNRNRNRGIRVPYLSAVNLFSGLANLGLV